ncbi:MAG: hypothetical protein ABII98_01085 [bacterium]
MREEKKEASNLSVAGLVLGILSIVFCWATIFNLPFIVLAIVFGVITSLDNRKLGMAGFICGICGFILSTTIIALALIFS